MKIETEKPAQGDEMAPGWDSGDCGDQGIRLSKGLGFVFVRPVDFSV